jgi:NAD(P)-dependent dehydrogenase (short-subunit alcohol dehydrogenase family)
MKILHVGASGIVGTAAYEALKRRGHDVVAAHRHSSDHPVDIVDPESIRQLLERVGQVEAVVSTAGHTPFGAWDQLARGDILSGLLDKFMGQVELVRQSAGYVTQGGSFTLTSGILGRQPVRDGSIAAAINGALEAWARASAGELWGRFRINVVSPTVLIESRDAYSEIMPGYPAVSSEDVGQAFVRSIESMESGQIYIV